MNYIWDDILNCWRYVGGLPDFREKEYREQSNRSNFHPHWDAVQMLARSTTCRNFYLDEAQATLWSRLSVGGFDLMVPWYEGFKIV